MLVLPVVREILEKARRSYNLVKKIKTINRDGTVFHQGYWVLPGMADIEGIPVGAQLDLFDQAPPKDVGDPMIPDFVYLEKKPTDAGGEVTKVFRTLAAEMAAYHQKEGSAAEVLEADFRVIAHEKYGIMPDGVSHFLDGVGIGVRDSWASVQKKLREVADGECGVVMSAFNTVVHSRYGSLSFPDAVRLYAGWIAKAREERRANPSVVHNVWYDKAHNIMNEFGGKYPEMWSVTAAIDNLLYVEVMREVAGGKRSFLYRHKNGKRVFKEAILPVSHDEAPTSADPLDRVRELVAKGVKTYADCVRIGAIIYDAVGMGEDEDAKRYEEIAHESLDLYEEYKRRLTKIRRMVEHSERLDSGVDRFSNIVNQEKYEAYNAKYEKMSAEFDEWTAKEYRPKAVALEKESKEIRKRMAEKASREHKNADLIAFLKQIRPFGPPPTMAGSVHGTPDAVHAAIKAMDVFPTAWMEKLATKPVRVISRAGSGSCRAYEARAPFSDNSPTSLSVQAHEIGHMVELANNLSEIARQFIYSLADEKNDGKIKGDRKAMRNWQKGIQSPALPDQYCGVLYDNNRDTEVVSTAAGYLYSDPSGRLNKGKLFWHFVLGLWAGV